MPYFVYKMIQGPTALVKNLEKLEQHDSFKEARKRARDLRANKPEQDNYTIKVMFAATELEAEEQLMEKREEPILREWEK